MHPLLRLSKLLSPFKGLIALSALLGFATVGSGIGLMAASAFIIAGAALHPSIAELQVAIVGVRFFGLSRGIFRYLERYISHQVTFRVLARLRVWFFQALEPLAPARLMQYRSGELISRLIGDIASLENFYVRAVAPPLVAGLVILAIGLLMSSFDLRLALILLLFLILAGIGLPLGMRFITRTAGRSLVYARVELNNALVDGIQGMPDLLAYGQESSQFTRVENAGQKLLQAQSSMAYFSGLQAALGGLLANMGMWAVLLLGIWLVRQARLEGVYLPVLVLAALASFEAVLPLPQAAQYLENNLEAARRLFDVIDAQPEVNDQPHPLPAPQNFSLVVQNLCFQYPQAVTRIPSYPTYSTDGFPALEGQPFALDNISFTLPQGGRLAIVGPSGAGKTTLVSLLLRFWEYGGSGEGYDGDRTSGHILLGGNELGAYSQDALREVMGVVSQHTYLFNTTVRENLMVARPEACEADMVHATQAAQIHDYILSLPQGYDTWIGEQGLRLSAGERQRLAIARALLKDAPIIILDEATANLDTLTERALLHSLYLLMEGRTALVITHRLIGLEHMDGILVLREGRIVERGRHAELVELGGLYRHMLDLQNQILQA